MLAIVFYKILILSVSGTTLFFLLTLIKPITKKLFSPSLNYYLMLITIVTFIVPYGMVMPKSQKAIVNVQTFIAQKSSVESNKKQSIMESTVIDNKDNLETASPLKQANGTKVPRAKTKKILDFNLVKELGWVMWILGAIISISVQLAGAIHFKKKLKATSRVAKKQEVKDLFYECCTQLDIHKNIFLRVCNEIGTPMVTGIITPVITIPTEEFDLNTLKMVFTHELMHYKRKDLWIKVISFGASALHWFNPVIYMVNRELDKHCELSCDWKIIKNMSSDEKKYYGLAILNVINDSMKRKMILGAGMAASSKNQLKERLFMIKSGKRPKKLITLFAMAIAVVLTITTGIVTNVLGQTKENKNSNDFAVMVKQEGLWAVNLSKSGTEILIDKSGVFKNISISPDGQNVAYTKDGSLYISSTDLTQEKKEILKVSERVISYGWVSTSDLSYSTEKGGLNGFNLESKKSSTYIESQDTYQGLVGDGKGTIYGEVYKYYTKDGKQYSEDKGVISYEVALGKEKVVVPSKPSNADVNGIESLGLMPTVAGISKDGAYVYIWDKVHSASTNSDGVAFGVYEVKNDKFTPFDKEQVFALAYTDNLAINPVDGGFPVINNGGNRSMNINKTLGEVDVTSGNFINILPKDMISTDGLYGSTAKGMVTMTPAFSPDGKKVIFSASNEDENMQQWNKEPHNIYTVDLETKKVEKITKDNTFDFAPTYVSKGAGVVFARRNDANNISLWKLQDNKEECITKNIKLDKDSWYYGHYKLENTLDIYISEK